ncbi:MAG: DUF2178 domain-containing protein [Dehalococcoidales bacterium]|nr:DUF2178 domain-containing protein [Dehalococcoidales bacterium]
MTRKTSRILTAVISAALAITVGWSITTGNVVAPITAVAAAVGLSYILRRNTREVTHDERTILLNEKAAGATIKVCVPVAAFAGIILFVLRESLSSEITTTAYFLTYGACILMIVQMAFYSYYSRKH